MSRPPTINPTRFLLLGGVGHWRGHGPATTSRPPSSYRMGRLEYAAHRNNRNRMRVPCPPALAGPSWRYSANFPLYTQPGHLGSLTYTHFPGCQVSVNTTNNLASWAKPRRINENERNGRPGCHWPGYFVGHLGNRQFQAPRPTRSRAQLTCPRVAIALRWERTSCPSGRQTPTPGE